MVQKQVEKPKDSLYTYEWIRVESITYNPTQLGNMKGGILKQLCRNVKINSGKLNIVTGTHFWVWNFPLSQSESDWRVSNLKRRGGTISTTACLCPIIWGTRGDESGSPLTPKLPPHSMETCLLYCRTAHLNLVHVSLSNKICFQGGSKVMVPIEVNGLSSSICFVGRP